MIWILAILLPLGSAMLLGIPRLRPAVVRVLMPLAALPALLAALIGPAPMAYPSLLLGVHLGPGLYGRPFLFPTALLWTAAGVFAVHLLRQDRLIHRFAFYFLMTMAGNIGLITAQDVPTFYACFALMTFSAYGLIVHDRNEKAMRAGRIYLFMALIGEGALVTAIFLAVSAAGTTAIQEMPTAVATASSRDLIILFAGIGFGIKAGAFLLHFWLPLAHPVAPTPASAVLSGCMIKAGLLGWLHFLPLGVVDLPSWGVVFTIFGVLALIFGVLAGLGEPWPKTILAYSSISQMGLMTMVLGLGLAHAAGWTLLLPVLLLLVINHTLAKGMLFLATGTAPSTGRSKSMRRLLLACASIPALVLAGLPWTGGAAAKAGLKESLPPSELFWPLPLDVLLLLSSTGTMLLLGHFLLRIRDTFPDRRTRPEPWLWMAWIALTPVLALALEWTSRIFGLIIALPETGFLEEMNSAWPILLGALLLIPFRRLCRECVLPPLISWALLNEQVVQAKDRALTTLDLFRPEDSTVGRALSRKYVRWFVPEVADPDALLRLERRFLHWYSMALVFVLMLALFLFLSYLEVMG
jgi:formate hydrogenlyase subunit 3/multisubunit Na+/H+ antiporter MnhD subunit